jgi:hypothetical protein
LINMSKINIGNGQVDVMIVVGIGGERQFKGGFSIPADMVKQSLQANNFPEMLKNYVFKEADRLSSYALSTSKKHLTLIPEAPVEQKQKEPEMQKPNRSMECLKQLISKGNYYSEIVEFLSKTDAIPRHVINMLSNPDPITKHKMLFDAIERACEFKALSMVHYSWTILPKEKIQLDMVSLLEHKSFIYEEA